MSKHEGHVIFADCLAELTDQELLAQCPVGLTEPATIWQEAVSHEISDRNLAPVIVLAADSGKRPALRVRQVDPVS